MNQPTSAALAEMIQPTDARALGEAFVAGLAAATPDALAALLTEDVGLRDFTTDHLRALRGHDKVVAYLRSERETRPDWRVSPLSVVGSDERVAVEYRAQYTAEGRYQEEARSAFLQVRDGRVHTIDAYRTAPIPSAHRDAYIAPADLSDTEIGRLFEELQAAWDVRGYIPLTIDAWRSIRAGWGGSGDAHPGSNGIVDFNSPAEVADERIETAIDHFRRRGIGFTWYVSPFDEPRDLPERLERHGLILAGDTVGMARVGLAPRDIVVNPDVEIQEIDGNDEAAIEAQLQIYAECFHWTPAQLDERRPGFLEEYRTPQRRETERGYLACLDGRPVGTATLIYKVGLAYMGGAAVLPEARGRKVYASLLAYRLAEADTRGYHIAAIQAGPMSRPIVARHGFKPYMRRLIYGWMPQPDLAVIRSLVPQE